MRISARGIEPLRIWFKKKTVHAIEYSEHASRCFGQKNSLPSATFPLGSFSLQFARRWSTMDFELGVQMSPQIVEQVRATSNERINAKVAAGVRPQLYPRSGTMGKLVRRTRLVRALELREP